MEDLHSIVLNVISAFICPIIAAVWLVMARSYRRYSGNRKSISASDATWVGEVLWLVRLLFAVVGLQVVCALIAYYWMYDTAWWRQGIGFVLSIGAAMLMLLAVSDDRSLIVDGNAPHKKVIRVMSLSIRAVAFILFYSGFINLVYLNPAAKQLRHWVAANGGDLSKALQHAALVTHHQN